MEWRWQLLPDAMALSVFLLALYALGARWAGARCDPPARVTRGQATLFALGVLTLYIGAGSPIHTISERYLLSVHMFQHLLFTLVAPPLMLLGTPGWMLRPLIRDPRVRRAAHAITRPFPAFVFFNLVLLLTHLPYITDLALRHHWFHFVVHLVLVLSATLMWFPVFSPLPELSRIGPFGQVVYLFVQQLVPAVIASFLAFASTPLYPFYTEAPQRLWGLSVGDDQQIAGIMMKLLGGTLMWAIMAVIFFRWFGREDRETAARTPARLEWPAVERELEQMGLTKQR